MLLFASQVGYPASACAISTPAPVNVGSWSTSNLTPTGSCAGTVAAVEWARVAVRMDEIAARTTGIGWRRERFQIELAMKAFILLQNWKIYGCYWAISKRRGDHLRQSCRWRTVPAARGCLWFTIVRQETNVVQRFEA